jgi:hypothetical protein
VVGASNDATGNIKYGGDWILESTNENIRDLYFTENISNYTSMLGAVSANGATEAIYLRMSSTIMEYSIGSLTAPSGTWSTLPWPVLITNSNPTPGLGSVLRVVATQALTMSTTTGGAASGFFYTGSQYITFDGAGNTITISGITSYLGFIQNGTSTLNGYANISVQNFIIPANTSDLSMYAGWLCQSYFGNGVSGNAISGCTNNAAISGYIVGGIAGSYAGSNSGGSITFTNCTNNGTISVENSGGVAGGLVGANSGLATFTGCVNNGTITANYVGGIVGYNCGQQGSATITDCVNNGNTATNAW